LDGFLRETDLEAKAKKMVTAVLGEVNEKPGTSIHIQPQSNLAIEGASLGRRVRKTTNPQNVNSLTLRGLAEFVLQFPILARWRPMYTPMRHYDSTLLGALSTDRDCAISGTQVMSRDLR
jgi:hypothetical protein